MADGTQDSSTHEGEAYDLNFDPMHYQEDFWPSSLSDIDHEMDEPSFFTELLGEPLNFDSPLSAGPKETITMEQEVPGPPGDINTTLCPEHPGMNNGTSRSTVASAGESSDNVVNFQPMLTNDSTSEQGVPDFGIAPDCMNLDMELPDPSTAPFLDLDMELPDLSTAPFLDLDMELPEPPTAPFQEAIDSADDPSTLFTSAVPNSPMSIVPNPNAQIDTGDQDVLLPDVITDAELREIIGDEAMANLQNLSVDMETMEAAAAQVIAEAEAGVTTTTNEPQAIQQAVQSGPSLETLLSGPAPGLSMQEMAAAYSGNQPLAMEEGSNQPQPWARRNRCHEVHPDFPSPELPLPPDITLEEICWSWPNHLYGDHLHRFIAEGWTGVKIYEHMPRAVQELTDAVQPWTKLTKRLSRERMKLEAKARARSGAARSQNNSSTPTDGLPEAIEAEVEKHNEILAQKIAGDDPYWSMTTQQQRCRLVSQRWVAFALGQEQKASETLSLNLPATPQIDGTQSAMLDRLRKIIAQHHVRINLTLASDTGRQQTNSNSIDESMLTVLQSWTTLMRDQLDPNGANQPLAPVPIAAPVNPEDWVKNLAGQTNEPNEQIVNTSVSGDQTNNVPNAAAIHASITRNSEMANRQVPAGANQIKKRGYMTAGIPRKRYGNSQRSRVHMFPGAPSIETKLTAQDLASKDRILDNFPEHLARPEIMIQFCAQHGPGRHGYPVRTMVERLCKHRIAHDDVNTPALEAEQRFKIVRNWVSTHRNVANKLKLHAPEKLAILAKNASMAATTTGTGTGTTGGESSQSSSQPQVQQQQQHQKKSSPVSLADAELLVSMATAGDRRHNQSANTDMAAAESKGADNNSPFHGSDDDQRLRTALQEFLEQDAPNNNAL